MRCTNKNKRGNTPGKRIAGICVKTTIVGKGTITVPVPEAIKAL
jgi:hypothetical protein